MLSKIWSDRINDYSIEIDHETDLYLPVKKMNLFIGGNNSGKSRFIRQLFAEPSPTFKGAFKINHEFRALVPEIVTFLDQRRISDETGEMIRLFTEQNFIPIENYSVFASSYIKLISRVLDGDPPFNSSDRDFYSSLRRQIGNVSGFKDRLIKSVELVQKYLMPPRIYIPILRGLRPVSNNDSYYDRTFKDYFKGTSIKSDRLKTGFDFYNYLVSSLLGQPEQRDAVRKYESLISEHFFEGQSVTLIPEHQKDTVSVKIGGDPQFPIYQLGDGLQQVLIISFYSYMEECHSIFFIEELEHSLHPGLIKRLTNFLLNCTEHQYFITTHSNHLLDIAESNDEVTVYRVQKNKKRSFFLSECSKDRDLLIELGVHPSSVYLANCSIWVEGITDRLYLREFMKKFINSSDEEERKLLNVFMENLHYTFIEYQGSNLVHWCFSDDTDGADNRGLNALRSSSSPLLIADGDIADKGDRVSQLADELGEQFILLECKEIENLLGETILRETAKRIYNGKRSKVDGEIVKLDMIKQGDYEKSPVGIGEYLDSLLGRKNVYAADSGTIKDKLKFCRTAVEVMSGPDIEWELTDQQNKICEIIFNHIKKCNLY